MRNVLYGYVAKLKAAIAQAGDPEVVLARRPGGYLLDADPERVDLYRFRRLAAEAAAAGRRAGRRRRCCGTRWDCGTGRPWPGWTAPG